MRNLTQREKDRLEDMIDAASLSGVIDTIAALAQCKADHISESYGEGAESKAWVSAGEHVSACARNVAREGL